MHHIGLVLGLVSVLACSQPSRPVQLGGGAAGSSSSGPKVIPLSGTATATGSARPK